MGHKSRIIANTAHISNKGASAKVQHRELRGKIKYYEYREGVNGMPGQRYWNDYLSEAQRGQRWQDRGLGTGYQEIVTNCSQAASQSVLAWTFVISPAPDIMQLLESDEERRQVLGELTDQIIENYYIARELPQPDYSWVMHQRKTRDGDPQWHTHVVLTGMVKDEDSNQTRPVFNNKPHMAILDRVSENALEQTMTRYIGPEWEQRRLPELGTVEHFRQALDKIAEQVATEPDLALIFPAVVSSVIAENRTVEPPEISPALDVLPDIDQDGPVHLGSNYETLENIIFDDEDDEYASEEESLEEIEWNNEWEIE